MRDGCFEPQSLEAWRQMVKPRSQAIDVGAYSGLYALIAAKYGARAIAIEPHPILVLQIQKNAKLNGLRIAIIEAAAADRESAAMLNCNRARLTSGGSLLRDRADKFLVRLTRIDGVATKNVSAIKIDVEGYELQVIEGARELISRDRPHMLIEALGDARKAMVEKALAKTHRLKAILDVRNLLFEPR